MSLILRLPSQKDDITSLVKIPLIEAIFSLLVPVCIGTLITDNLERIGLIRSSSASHWTLRLGIGFGLLGVCTLISLIFTPIISHYSTIFEVVELTGNLFSAFFFLCVILVYLPVSFFISVSLSFISIYLERRREERMTRPIFSNEKGGN